MIPASSTPSSARCASWKAHRRARGGTTRPNASNAWRPNGADGLHAIVAAPRADSAHGTRSPNRTRLRARRPALGVDDRRGPAAVGACVVGVAPAVRVPAAHRLGAGAHGAGEQPSG